MIGEIGFGMIDNGVLVFGAIAGFSFEDLINDKISKFNIQTRIKGLSSSLLGAGIGNAISDFLGGFCVSPEMAIGSFTGCMLIVLIASPFIFQIKKEIVA